MEACTHLGLQEAPRLCQGKARWPWSQSLGSPDEHDQLRLSHTTIPVVQTTPHTVLALKSSPALPMSISLSMWSAALTTSQGLAERAGPYSLFWVVSKITFQLQILMSKVSQSLHAYMYVTTYTIPCTCTIGSVHVWVGPLVVTQIVLIWPTLSVNWSSSWFVKPISTKLGTCTLGHPWSVRVGWHPAPSAMSLEQVPN